MTVILLLDPLVGSTVCTELVITISGMSVKTFFSILPIKMTFTHVITGF